MILQKDQLQILQFVRNDQIHWQDFLSIEIAWHNDQHSRSVFCLSFEVNYKQNQNVLDMNEEREKMKNKKKLSTWKFKITKSII